MTIEKNNIVSVHYTLHAIEENGDKTFIEKTDPEIPFTFLYGVGMMLPKFEKELQGMTAGDKKSFTITPEEGYGIRNDEATAQLPIAMFEQTGLPESGSILPLQDAEGNQVNALVLVVTEDAVHVDLNHPMAGQTLNFDIELESTRPATEAELTAVPMAINSEEN